MWFWFYIHIILDADLLFSTDKTAACSDIVVFYTLSEIVSFRQICCWSPMWMLVLKLFRKKGFLATQANNGREQVNLPPWGRSRPQPSLSVTHLMLFNITKQRWLDNRCQARSSLEIHFGAWCLEMNLFHCINTALNFAVYKSQQVGNLYCNPVKLELSLAK